MNYSNRKQAEASEIMFKSIIAHTLQPPVMHTEAEAQTYQTTIDVPGASQCDLFTFKHSTGSLSIYVTLHHSLLPQCKYYIKKNSTSCKQRELIYADLTAQS